MPSLGIKTIATVPNFSATTRKLTPIIGKGTLPLSPKAILAGVPINFIIDRSGRFSYHYDGSGNLQQVDTLAQTPAMSLWLAAASIAVGGVAQTIISMDVNQQGEMAIYATTSQHNFIRIDLTTKAVTLVAGTGASGSADGTGSAASFGTLFNVSVDFTGTYALLLDNTTGNLRKVVLSTKVVSSLAFGIGAWQFQSSIDTQGNIYFGAGPAAVKISQNGSHSDATASYTGLFIPLCSVDNAVPAAAAIYYVIQNNGGINSLFRRDIAAGTDTALAQITAGNNFAWMFYRPGGLVLVSGSGATGTLMRVS